MELRHKIPAGVGPRPSSHHGECRGYHWLTCLGGSVSHVGTPQYALIVSYCIQTSPTIIVTECQPCSDLSGCYLQSYPTLYIRWGCIEVDPLRAVEEQDILYGPSFCAFFWGQQLCCPRHSTLRKLIFYIFQLSKHPCKRRQCLI